MPPPCPSADPDLRKLLASVEAGDFAAVAGLLDRRPELARAHGPDGQTALHLAAQCNDDRMGLLLLQRGADGDAKLGSSGHTPLSWAVTCDASEFARFLIRAGLRPDLFCSAGIGSLEHVRGFFDESGRLQPGASRTGSSRIASDGTRLHGLATDRDGRPSKSLVPRRTRKW